MDRSRKWESSAIGPVMQFAFVPKDFDAAIRHWTETMGVGPLTSSRTTSWAKASTSVSPDHCVFSIAIAYWGDMQIELVRQENDAPSIDRGCEGEALHHTCILTDDIENARRIAEELWRQSARRGQSRRGRARA